MGPSVGTTVKGICQPPLGRLGSEERSGPDDGDRGDGSLHLRLRLRGRVGGRRGECDLVGG